VLFIASTLVSLAAAWIQPLHAPENFDSFVAKYNRTYSGLEKERRLHIFQANMIWAASLGSSYGITPMADLTQAEFRSQYLMKNWKPADNVVYKQARLSGKAPASVDWRNNGVVTPVYNQGQCGSCWAFSATEEVESMNAMAGNSLVQLSMQQVVSCDSNDNGCNGGNTVTAYQYIESAGGLCPYSSYPYNSGGGDNGQCMSSSCTPSVNINGYTFAIPPCQGGACTGQNENQMMDAVATNGPVSVCLNANDAWQVYTGGLFTATCSSNFNAIDHCVQVVGYDTTQGTPYWIVRNSWATDWGNNGYIWIPIGSNDCSIASYATFVSIA